jgi:hypothetical protein
VLDVLGLHAERRQFLDAQRRHPGSQFVIEAGLHDADTEIVSIEPAGLSFVSALHSV